MMDIKLTTVKTHVSHILEKLDVKQAKRGQNRRQASEADPGGLKTPSSA